MSIAGDEEDDDERPRGGSGSGGEHIEFSQKTHSRASESSAAVKTPAITGRRVGCFAARSPDDFYPEDSDLRVVGRDRHPAVLALRGEHAIERIAVLLRS